MLGTLAALQLTYLTFSHEMFLAVNMLTFLVGLHTALSYSVQVDIWETGKVGHRKLFAAVLIAVAVILVGVIFRAAPPAIMACGLAYLVYRFSDRLSFNTLITRGQVAKAYGVSIVAITVEIAMFYLLANRLPESLARLLIPSVIAGAVPTLVFAALSRTGAHDSKRPMSGARRHDLAFAGHSLAILFVVMIDRVAPTLNSALRYLDAQYLLLFSYAGAIYSIGVAVLEPLRPRYFAVAKEESSFQGFLAATEAGKIAIPVLAVTAIGAITAFAVSTRHGFANPESFGHFARDVLTGGGLLSFFSLFLLLAYVQMYFLSRREFGIIFLSWSAAFFVRLAGLASQRLDLYLAFSNLSAVTAIAVFFFASNRKTWSLA